MEIKISERYHFPNLDGALRPTKSPVYRGFFVGYEVARFLIKIKGKK